MAFPSAMAAGSTSTFKPRSGGEEGAWAAGCCARAIDIDNAVTTTLATHVSFLRDSPETGRMIAIFRDGRNRDASMRARSGDQAYARLESCIGPQPVEQHDEAGTKADKERDVDQAPQQPGQGAVDLQPAEVGDRRAPADRRHGAIVSIAERSGRRSVRDPR